METEVVWTRKARQDLKQIYEFNILLINEENSFQLIQDIISKIDVLYSEVIGSTRYISLKFPTRNYQKLVWKNYLIIFRKEGTRIFIVRIFDARQDPKKIGL